MIKAKYTVVLKTLLDDSESRVMIDDALSHYPLYAIDKHYDLIPTREQLNQRLLDAYKYREIGFETVGRFLDELRITMGNIMPHYNELFKTVVTMAELPSPFDNVDVVETFKQTSTGSGKTTSTGTTTADTQATMEDVEKNVHSDTPQGKLSITGKDIDKVDYADSAEWKKNESTSNGTSTTTGSQNAENVSSSSVEHTYTKVGNQGVNTYAHDMNEFRTSIMDVVDSIVNDRRIQELFMLVY